MTPGVALRPRTQGAHSRGYFAPDRFASRAGQLGRSELALNPDAFIERTDEQILSTLCHECCHVWQHHFGSPGNRGYHNCEWAGKMRSIGLMPSNTGAVGGKETGSQMTHYIIEGGPFQQSFVRLATTGWKLNLQSAPHRGAEAKKNASKTKFACAGCSQNAWGKPDLAILCILCQRPMLSERLAADVVADMLCFATPVDDRINEEPASPSTH